MLVACSLGNKFDHVGLSYRVLIYSEKCCQSFHMKESELFPCSPFKKVCIHQKNAQCTSINWPFWMCVCVEFRSVLGSSVWDVYTLNVVCFPLSIQKNCTSFQVHSLYIRDWSQFLFAPFAIDCMKSCLVCIQTSGFFPFWWMTKPTDHPWSFICFLSITNWVQVVDRPSLISKLTV